MKETTLSTSRIILGTVQFGLDYGISNRRGKVPQEEVCRILEFAHSKGITTLDTAAAYGESEFAIGSALRETGLKFNIISKLPPVKEASEVRQKVEESLEKLQVEQLQGYMLHNFSIYQQIPHVIDELFLLQQEGLITKTGVSLYHPVEALELMEKEENINLLQLPFNVFDQRFESVLDKLQQSKLEVHARSVFLQGLFFMNPHNLPVHFASAATSIREVQHLAKQNEIPLEALLLLFVLSQSGIDAVTIGVNTLENLQKNLEAEKYFTISQQLFPELKKYKLIDEDVLLPYKWKTA